MTITYKSNLENLNSDFFNKTFNIPIYQRLYVWKSDQVLTLIEDLVNAYKYNPKKDYFLGGIVVVKNIENGHDLVDGQQRFTTLKILTDYLGSQNLKLEFSIRDDVWDQFNLEKEPNNKDILRMKNAQHIMKEYVERKIEIDEKIKFTDYLLSHVNLVVTEVPKNTDLNKLFELINGRGEQLLQHEILKAKFLGELDNEEDKHRFGAVWDICSNMDEFLETNIKKSIGNTWSEHEFSLPFNNLMEKIKHKNSSKKYPNEDSLFLSKLINKGSTLSDDTNKKDDDDDNSIQYLSIISFELFLLYILVIYKKDEYFNRISGSKVKVEFKDKNLIQIFHIVLGELSETDSRKFIKRLYESRVLFDNYVIKNHMVQSNEIKHDIYCVEIIDKNKIISKKFRYEKGASTAHDLSLLQSMLYHSHTRNTQEWLIPFLSHINFKTSHEDALTALKNIDNHLYSQINPDLTILKRASSFDCSSKNKVEFQPIKDYLGGNPENYHHFSHYWFYKMDWMIWDQSDKSDTQFKFTARNSIEHISPQNPDDKNSKTNQVSEGLLHSFGNLALVSIAQNSSFSNAGFKEKMGSFNDKEIKNLKLSLISECDEWGDSQCAKHLEGCIKKVKNYFEMT